MNRGLPFIFTLFISTTSAQVLDRGLDDDSWRAYHHKAYQANSPRLSERIAETRQVATNPAIRDQDGFGTCYLFAATSLMDQACQKSGMCNEDDQISVLDVLGKTQGKDSEFHGLNGGNLRQVYQSINPDPNKRVKFAREQCAPYQQIENYNNASNDFSIQDYPQLNAIKKIYEDAKKPKNKADCEDCTTKAFKSYFAFNNEILENLEKAVSKIATINAFSDFLDEVLVPEKCKKDLIEMPKFEMKEEHIPTKMGLRKKLIELVNKDQSIAITSCTWTRSCEDSSIKNINECPQESRNRVCGGHAYLLSGYRRICPKRARGPKLCRHQYKVHNSWGEDFNFYNADGWVDEDEVFKAYKDLGDEVVTYVDKIEETVFRPPMKQTTFNEVYSCEGSSSFGDKAWALNMRSKGFFCYPR